MHIKKLHEMNISKKSQNLVNNIDSSTDYGILEWISQLANDSKSEEIKKYISLCGITDGDMENQNFLEEKKLKHAKKYFETGKEINLLEKKMEKEYWVAAHEVLYHFQEDLIHNDFDSLVEWFLDEEGGDEILDEEGGDEILPEIKEKYKDIIEVKMESRKFNF